MTPTRELAYQIFEVLRKIGKCHDFSAALLIGGQNLKHETPRLAGINILVCTPGRLLQHMDENYLLDCNLLQILVLDEADKILEMGFRDTVDAIIANLPPNRQTLLFSATQTRKVEDLSRLALKNPDYVSAHEESAVSTPKALQSQTYMVCSLKDKLNVLFSFVKGHLKTKTLVFLSTCKQVRFVHQCFRKLRPFVPLLALHGGMPQMRRTETYNEFCNKKFVFLFATDIAARGLDFPDVDWVVQADCPENVKTYIHRVGRTARQGGTAGQALTLLLESELKIIDELTKSKVPISETHIGSARVGNIEGKLRSFNAEFVDLHDTAKKAFKSYCKFVYTCSNKEVFSVEKLNLDHLAESLGLVSTPRLRFLKGNLSTADDNNVKKKKISALNDDDTGLKELKSIMESLDKAEDTFVESKNKKRDLFASQNEVSEPQLDKKPKKISNAKYAKSLLRKNLKECTHIKFDDLTEGELGTNFEAVNKDENDTKLDLKGGINLDALKERLKARDKIDRKNKKSLMKEKRIVEKIKSKTKKESEGYECVLKTTDNNSDEELNDESDTEGVPKRKMRKKSRHTMNAVEEPKADMFDYEQLAKQEDLILQLIDS